MKLVSIARTVRHLLLLPRLEEKTILDRFFLLRTIARDIIPEYRFT